MVDVLFHSLEPPIYSLWNRFQGQWKIVGRSNEIESLTKYISSPNITPGNHSISCSCGAMNISHPCKNPIHGPIQNQNSLQTSTSEAFRVGETPKPKLVLQREIDFLRNHHWICVETKSNQILCLDPFNPYSGSLGINQAIKIQKQRDKQVVSNE